jgi:hypothetical protein
LVLAVAAGCGSDDASSTCDLLDADDLGFTPQPATEGVTRPIIGNQFESRDCELVDDAGDGVLITIQVYTDSDVFELAVAKPGVAVGRTDGVVGTDGVVRYGNDLVLLSIEQHGTTFTDDELIVLTSRAAARL